MAAASHGRYLRPGSRNFPANAARGEGGRRRHTEAGSIAVFDVFCHRATPPFRLANDPPGCWRGVRKHGEIVMPCTAGIRIAHACRAGRTLQLPASSREPVSQPKLHRTPKYLRGSRPRSWPLPVSRPVAVWSWQLLRCPAAVQCGSSDRLLAADFPPVPFSHRRACTPRSRARTDSYPFHILLTFAGRTQISASFQRGVVPDWK